MILVTGGGGFLGGAVVRQLLARGESVRSLQRSDVPALRDLGVQVVRADLADADAVVSAANGCEAIIHVAAKAGVWGAYGDYYHANVVGTRNVIEACRKQRIRRLVYTSTPSVIHSGGDVEGVDESVPMATHFDSAYPATKAEAERMVLAANGPDLATVALRPHLIWGPGDPQLVARILARARAGRLRLVGGGVKLIDSVYIDNAAHAHLAALDHLAPGSSCSGKAYFITQGEPMPQRELINGILKAGGLPSCGKSLSPSAAYAVGALLEIIWRMLGRADEPMMTRFLARQLATAHWYDISAARRDLGYTPLVTVAEGLARLEADLQNHDRGEHRNSNTL
ncbi:MAG: NAD-dependent epimerase/dehydratase family protein [Holophagaceae bacterium]|nr:NAD-dependent epimerase/dehydratase family protein [Holophagaceae bacterium]